MTYDMVNEWGGVDLSPSPGLLEFRYQNIPLIATNYDDNNNNNGSDEIISTATFADWMNITQLTKPEEATQLYQQQQQQQQQQQSNNENEAILILGCGNSKLGEQFLTHSFVGPILQLDISSKVIQLMTQRYRNYLSADDSVVKRMEFFVDDASTGLTSLEPDSVGGGVVDKGLLDVLHCSAGTIINDLDSDDDGDDDNMIQRIMGSVHNVLQPSRPFIFFSRSEPQWMLRRVLGQRSYDDLVSGSSHDKDRTRRTDVLWKDIKVVQLVDHDLLLYKLVKAEEDHDATTGHDGDQMGTEVSTINRLSYLNKRKGRAKKSKWQ